MSVSEFKDIADGAVVDHRSLLTATMTKAGLSIRGLTVKRATTTVAATKINIGKMYRTVRLFHHLKIQMTQVTPTCDTCVYMRVERTDYGGVSSTKS